ncbi:Gfo/Idh/MocA family protein [Candidatus Magnetaquicoccus inordinatus]|uniref:Gfo/Idh/MocA family protein n=1 Tax=Candidatus Magnetaquicoccus inordinatus TaxID=2496818 RepID=UPI001D0EA199|nr:Gfo/Idh/MocA family oxidoreductase [Candidatus Magnetaquicoccus inordinatus]
MKIRVGLIGFGYWGPYLYRNFNANPGFVVKTVADQHAQRRNIAKGLHLQLQVISDGEEIAKDPEIDLVVIATPVATHYHLAKLALEHGKHVLVEKPFCSSVSQAEELLELAKKMGVLIFLDHTYLFTTAVQMIQKICHSDELGKISYYDSMRVNLGLFQPDVNVLWDLAPHDFSIVDYLFREEPLLINATGYCHVNQNLPDIVYITMHFPSAMVAHFNLSWMSPVKVRRTFIGGSAKMLLWDDLESDQKIKIYNSGISFQPEDDREVIIPSYRLGDVYSPRVENREALASLVEHCRRVITGKEESRVSGENGLRVMRLLERTQAVLDLHLAEVAALRSDAS